MFSESGVIDGGTYSRDDEHGSERLHGIKRYPLTLRQQGHHLQDRNLWITIAIAITLSVHQVSLTKVPSIDLFPQSSVPRNPDSRVIFHKEDHSLNPQLFRVRQWDSSQRLPRLENVCGLSIVPATLVVDHLFLTELVQAGSSRQRCAASTGRTLAHLGSLRSTLSSQSPVP